MGNTTNVIILFDGYYVPRYVNYGGMVIRCTLYKKHIDMCYECRSSGTQGRRVPQPERQEVPRVRMQQPARRSSVRAGVPTMRKGSPYRRPQVQSQVQDTLPRQAATVGAQNA
ncbi:hypothetical protein MTO96_038246 [Rhipicephalus appendiculatus]